jgi:hypothetical protein
VCRGQFADTSAALTVTEVARRVPQVPAGRSRRPGSGGESGQDRVDALPRRGNERIVGPQGVPAE